MSVHVVLQGRIMTFLVMSDSSTVVLLLNVSSFVSVWLNPGDNQMGRPEQRVRERKRAAASCKTLDSFLPPAKRNRSTSDSVHSIPAASIKLEATASQDASVIRGGGGGGGVSITYSVHVHVGPLEGEKNPPTG